MAEPLDERRRVVVWEDPGILAREGGSMSGIDCLTEVLAGKLPAPPVCALVDFQLTEVAEGRTAGTLEPAEYHYNPFGNVHGGVLVTLMDTVMSSAVHTMLPAGVLYSTLEVKTNFVRGVTAESGTLRCEGHVVHSGSRTATAECRVTDSAGALCAHGTVTCLIMRPPATAP